MSDRLALRVFIGPVQSFIASGRRTRDFWAGSFLLSWLSGVAMNAVLQGDGQITIPAVQDADGFVTERTLKAIRRELPDGRGPLVGTLVNHFRAEVPADFNVNNIETAVRSEFKKLAHEVFEVFIKPALEGGDPNGVKERWEAQTNGAFFEVLAVVGEASDWPEESQWLARRKMLRTHAPIRAEAGADRCPVHGDLAELGGYSGQYQREQQGAFWKEMRSVVGTRMYERGGAGSEDWRAPGRKFRDTLELRESEHLSGMALVKRLFPLLTAEKIAGVLGWMPDHIYDTRTPDQAWNPEEAQFALRNWPSTAFIAAIPWIVKVGGAYAGEPGKTALETTAATYAENQYNRLGAHSILEAERPQHHRVEGIEALTKVPVRGALSIPKIAVLDGTLHFKRGLEKRRFDDGSKDAEQIANELQAEFRSLVNTVRKDPAKLGDGPASTHYAMLDMDGDGMGKVFSQSQALAKTGSMALLRFAEGVPAIVYRHDGILIYAGADDVNAMLPIETAIACASALNAHWTQTMAGAFKAPKDRPTLSGSIVFADYQNALDDVRRLTHARLDTVAKDRMGRDALALAVMKSGGVAAEWASSWQGPQPEDPAAAPIAPVETLFDYARAASRNKTIASRLPYLIRERFGEVMGQDGHGDEMFDDADLAKFLRKEMSDSGLSGLGATNIAKARKIVELMRPYHRPVAGGGPQPAPRHVGGLLVARFLAQNCMWSYVDDWAARSGGAA